LRLAHPFAGEQVAAIVVGDRQGITSLSIAEREMALEVGAPYAIRPVAARAPAGMQRDAQAPATWTNEATALEQLADRAGGRDNEPWVSIGDISPELFRCG